MSVRPTGERCRATGESLRWLRARGARSRLSLTDEDSRLRVVFSGTGHRRRPELKCGRGDRGALPGRVRRRRGRPESTRDRVRGRERFQALPGAAWAATGADKANPGWRRWIAGFDAARPGG